MIDILEVQEVIDRAVWEWVDSATDPDGQYPASVMVLAGLAKAGFTVVEMTHD